MTSFKNISISLILSFNLNKNAFLFKLVLDNEIVVNILQNKCNFLSNIFVFFAFYGSKEKVEWVEKRCII